MATLLPLVYDELRALAGSYLRQSPSHTLQPTALVHEAFVKLARVSKVWEGPEHFMATAAMAMRQVLVDHARRKNADKRGGAAGPRIALEGVADANGSTDMLVSEVDALLLELAKTDARSARVAEMRVFGGMLQEEIAVVLNVSRATVASDWRFARAWLAAKLKDERNG